MNENIVTNASEKKAIFTVKRIMRVLSLLCIVCAFCPSFLVSCAGNEAKIDIMTAVQGVKLEDNEWIAEPHTFMLVCLLIPILVLVLLFIKKNREKQTAVIIAGSTVADFIIWLIFKAKAERIAENWNCSFKVTGWYKVNLIALLLIILMSMLIVINVVRLNTDLVALFSGGGARTALNQMSGAVSLISSTARQMSDNVVASINNNKGLNENMIISCSKCGLAIPNGSKFCMSCGTSVSECTLAEGEAAGKDAEEEAGNEDVEEEAEESVLEKEMEQKASEQKYDIPRNTQDVAKGLCIECGAHLRDDVKFCTKCGTRIKLRKIDIDRQNSEEQMQPMQSKPIQSQKSVEKISGKQINKLAIAAIVVIVIGITAGGIVYTRIRRTNMENAENATANMQDLLVQQGNEQFAEDLLEQQDNEQFDSEIVEADNVKADEAQNESPKAPQVIQLDSRYIKSIQASSELTDSTKTYKVETVLDGNKETCWSEGVSGTGEGELIYIEFTRPVYISEVAFLNGYMKNETVYNANGKIKRAELELDGGSYEVELNDWQYQEVEKSLYSDRFTMDTPVWTQSLSIMILEAQEGTKYDDICLTELAIWGYADDTGDAVELSAGGADIYDLYDTVIDEVALMYGNDCEYALYDMDHDGTVELITSQGSSNADWSNTVYTVDRSGMLVEVGTFYGMVSLYAAENGDGIYSVYGHMSYQEVEWITKNGNELHTETILSGEVEEYYENENPILMVEIDKNIMNF